MKCLTFNFIVSEDDYKGLEYGDFLSASIICSSDPVLLSLSNVFLAFLYNQI